MLVDRTSRIHKYLFKKLFFCVFGCSLLFGIFFTMIVRKISDDSDNAIVYIENWTVTDEAGNSFEVGRSYNDKRAYTEDFTIISRLPDEIGHGNLLCFMNGSDVSVYINGELRKDFKNARDTGIPGGFLKEFYLQVPLSSSDGGAEIKIERIRTDRNPMVVSETFISSSQGVYGYMVDKYGVNFFLSIVLFIASLLASVVGIVMRVWMRQSIDMLYAALGILDVACWLIAVSQFTPFVTGIYYVDGFMGFLFCMMMPFALLIYFNSIQKNRYRKVHAILFILSLVNMIFWTTIHFMGIQSLQKSIIYIDSVLGIVVVCVLGTLVIDIRKGYVRDYSYTATGFFFNDHVSGRNTEDCFLGEYDQ